MSERREIVFSAREDNVTALTARIKRAVEQLDQASMSSSRNQKEASKDIIKDREKEIQLLEKQRDLTKQVSDGQRKQDSSTTLNKPSDKFYADREAEVAKAWKTYTDKNGGGDPIQHTQISSGKPPITNTRQPSNNKTDSTKSSGSTSKLQELRIERLRIRELRIDQDKSSRSENPQNQSILGKSKKKRSSQTNPFDSKTQKGRSDRGIDGSDVAGALQGNGPGAMQMLKGAGPAVIGLGIVGLVASFIKKAFTNEMSREESLSKLSGTSGRSVYSLNNFEDDGYFGRGARGRRDRTTYGFSEEDFMSRAAPTARAFGTSQNINKNILDSMALERGTGMDEGLVNEMNRLSRVISSNGNSTDMTQSIYKAMYSTGAFGKDNTDLSRLNELVGTFVSHQESDFMRSGNISSGSPFLNLRGRLENTGEDKFKRDDYTASTIGSLNQGLYSEGSPEVQALKMDILRKANPNKGYFELQAEQEKGIESKGFLSGVMDVVKNTGGDTNQQAILLNQMTGGSMRKSDILSLLKGDIDVSDIEKTAGGRNPSLDIEKRAENATSELRDAMESLTGELSKFTQDFMNASRNIPAWNIYFSSIVQGIDAIKKELQ